MKYELMIFSSCGHVVIEEVPRQTFQRYTTQKGHTAMGEMLPCRFRVGRTLSRAYVYPGRFTVCNDCAEF